MKRLLLLALLQASPAHADVTLGAVLSLTGPGAGSRNLFGATLWDSVLVLDRAAGPALATAGPGTPEFRVALRNAMERVHGLAGAEGVFSLSPSDHSGAELGSQVLIEIRGGGYRLVPS